MVSALQAAIRMAWVISLVQSPAAPAGQGGGVFAGVILAVGEQVEPGVDDVGEQVGGPAAPVEAQRHLPVLAGDAAGLGQQAADLAGQGG